MPFVTVHLEIFHCTHHPVIPKADLYFTFCSTLNACSKDLFQFIGLSECSYQEFLQCTVNNALFEFFFVMLNQNIDFSFFESFIYNRN